MSPDDDTPYSEPQWLSPEGIPVNVSCGGFHLAAEDFLAAAKAYAPVARQGSFVAHYLCCQSVELSLKAFLSLKGMNRQQLNALGHRLHLLFGEALGRGIADLATIESTDPATLHAFNEWYDVLGNKRYGHFYFPDLPKDASEFALIEGVASRLQSSALRAAVRRGTP